MRQPLNHLTTSNIDRFTSSPFGPRSGGYHYGIDLIGAKVGDPVRSMLRGTVVTAKFDASAGNFVRVDHGRGVHTRYLHMDSFSVRAGQTVTEGQIVGTYGNTGQSTRPHLHLDVEISGTRVDPAPYLKGQPLHRPGLTVNGRPVTVAVKVEGGRTWVQLAGERGPVWVQVRSFADSLGARLEWDQATLTAKLTI